MASLLVLHGVNTFKVTRKLTVTWVKLGCERFFMQFGMAEESKMFYYRVED